MSVLTVNDDSAEHMYKFGWYFRPSICMYEFWWSNKKMLSVDALMLDVMPTYLAMEIKASATVKPELALSSSTCYRVVMDEDEELASMLEWIEELKTMGDEDFQVQARPYFNDTVTMKALPREEAVEHVKQERYKGKHRA